MMNFNKKNKPAFTMIELVMVIVVLGILASLAMPRLERDVSQEAADNILSNIRYTQHLALIDDMHEYNKPKWQRKFWHIDFNACDSGGLYFRIGSDSNKTGGGFSEEEAAIDPINGKSLFATNSTCDNAGTNANVLLGKKYDVTAVTGTGGCNGVQYIGFDHLGRPHIGFQGSTKPDYTSYMQNRCVLTFTVSGDTFKINIEPETGYAFIDGQTGS